MITIWKYPLSVPHSKTDEQTIVTHKGAVILCVQTQQELPCLWVKVNTENELEPIKIRTFGTGHDMIFKGSNKYIGSYQLRGGSFIGHVYWEG